jgi:electron transfer flavoprotein beta subunit
VNCIVLLKLVALQPSIDPLTGVALRDPHGGLSAADRCALELAVQTGDEVLALTAGPAAAERVLREALAGGAARAVRIELPSAASSLQVARVLAAQVAGPALVWAGDQSLDRGSGSVPAYVAGLLGWAQALGLVAVTAGDPLRVQRRLDAGRRERLAVTAPAVLSVEAGVITPRRPTVRALLQAQRAEIAVVHTSPPVPEPGRSVPFRPRARVLPGPDPGLSARDRLVTLSGALREHQPPRVVHADPEQAADELLTFLRARGVPR